MIRTGTTLATVLSATLLAGVVLVSGASTGDVAGGKVLLLRIDAAHAVQPAVDGDVVSAGGRRVSFPARVEDVADTDGGLYVLVDGTLWVTDLDAVLRTGVTGVQELVASPDGRYLGFVDHGSGTDAHGTSRSVVTIYDTTTGVRVVHSAEGRGEAANDDLAALYRALS